jgi:hypothetical protein
MTHDEFDATINALFDDIALTLRVKREIKRREMQRFDDSISSIASIELNEFDIRDDYETRKRYYDSIDMQQHDDDDDDDD